MKKEFDFTKINWADLKEQKNTVIAMQQYFGPDSLLSKNLEGLLSLIDSIQDHAVDVLGYDENVVFNLTDDTKKEKLVCSNCGSTKITEKCWIDPNTLKVDETAALDEGDRWCDSCESHVDFTLKTD
ncbi:MAG: hypothetical protein ACOC2U_04010 [bacterium]